MMNDLHRPEQLGIIAAKSPVKTLLAFMGLIAFALIGFLQFQSDDSLTELFRSNSQDFKKFEEMGRKYPSNEYDVLVVLEADNLLTNKRLESLRTLTIGLNFVDSVKGLISLFSAQRLPNKAGKVLPLIPAIIPEGAALKKLQKEILQNELIGGKLISNDGSLALIVMALNKEILQEDGLEASILSIKQTISDMLKGSDIRHSLSGVPVMQLEIRNTIDSDRLLYNSLGFILGALICYLFFRRLSFVILAIAPPAVAIILSLGTLGLLGIKLNMFLNVIVPLIMVIAFSDSMHMVFSIRRELIAGATKQEAVFNTLRSVGSACFLTSALTAIALFSLMLSSSAMIQTFGLAAGFFTLVAFLVIITLIPALTLFIVNDNSEKIQSLKKYDSLLDGLERKTLTLFEFIKPRAKLVSAIMIGLTVLTGIFFSILEPKYRLADQVPDKEEAIHSAERIDKKLTGANPIHVMIEWPKSESLYSTKTLNIISQVHSVMEKQPKVGNVWSVEMLRRWLITAGKPGNEVLKEYVGYFPKHLASRFIEKGGHSVVVTGRVPDLDVHALLPVIEQVDTALEQVRKANPTYQISLTGLAVISSKNSATMIRTLSLNLILTILLVVAMLAVIFRSAFLGFIILLPNLLPIFATATLLYFMGTGLQFASVIALTVAFGLSVDNAIHFTHRLVAKEKGQLLESENIRHVMRVVGPVVILTMIVLALGMGVTIFSGLPSLRLFGGLNAMTLFFSMVAVLVMLPAFLFAFSQRQKKKE